MFGKSKLVAKLCEELTINFGVNNKSIYNEILFKGNTKSHKRIATNIIFQTLFEYNFYANHYSTHTYTLTPFIHNTCVCSKIHLKMLTLN